MLPLPFASTRLTADINAYESLERLFSRSDLLRQALTHPSSRNTPDNQRFEFLGDAVIELTVRWSLLQDSPGASEGELTRMKIGLVRKSTLARCADRLGLRELIITGGDFRNGEIPDSVAADAYEAVAGALFADSGFPKAMDFVRQTLLHTEETSGGGDPKSRLQEYCQARRIPLPEYHTERVTGPPHAPVFDISVTVNGKVLGRGRAASRKNAEMAAAEMALKKAEGEE